MNKNRIIVIGGGYGGLRAIEKLSKNPKNEITLFDKNPYHFMQTDVYDLIANEDDFAHVSVDLFTFCSGFNNNVTFLKQEVKSVDFKNKKVITALQRYSYDYLIIAVGSRTKFVSSVEGLREHAHGIKALHRAMFFKQKFEMSLFHRVEASGTSCTPLNIVIAGAGLSGVEVAAQMASFSRDFYKKHNFICRKLNIVLINSSKSVLGGFDAKLAKKTDERLKELGIVIKNERKVVAVTHNSVTLSCGETLDMDFMIYTGGIEPNGLVYNLALDKNERGYIITNSYLQVQNYSEVFAIGDCTTIYKNAKAVPATADTAEQMGELCAKNINNLAESRPLIEHNIDSRGVLIALGKNYASAKIFNIYINGYIAYVMKKIIEKLYATNLNIYSKKGSKKIFCE